MNIKTQRLKKKFGLTQDQACNLAMIGADTPGKVRELDLDDLAILVGDDTALRICRKRKGWKAPKPAALDFALYDSVEDIEPPVKKTRSRKGAKK